MASNNLEETKLLLRQVWTFLLMGLYGIGIFQERSVVLQKTVAQTAESIIPNAARLIFFGLIFVSFLIDIVEMREDKSKAYQFLFLSLVAGSLSATISAVQYNVLAQIFGGG